jgi:YesN/AraC family two-component response regulator
MITDIVMPRLSGGDLAYILENKIPHMKTLYMSGYTDNTIVHHGILNNGIPFLQKPFDINDVCKKVREVLDN